MPPNYQPLPPLTDDEYAALMADIKANGVLVPIEVDENGNVLDGHHRARICEELGISPPTVVRTGLTEDQKHEHALRLNLTRRHLTTVQKRDLIHAELKRDASRSNRAIARLLGVDHKTVAACRNGTPLPVRWVDIEEELDSFVHIPANFDEMVARMNELTELEEDVIVWLRAVVRKFPTVNLPENVAALLDEYGVALAAEEG
jgi:ParB-like chromosome segregation protein Spo0J